MVKRLEAIDNFLRVQECRNPIWNRELETQVTVTPADGERKERTYKGRKFFTFYNEERDESWASFRIPKKAFTDDHYYSDSEMQWDLSRYAEGIGSTGWNHRKNLSEWVGYDFDSIIGHERGLSAEEIEEVKGKLWEIEWVQIRRSKSGKGFHVLVHLEDPPETKNHHEHAALARAILHSMSGITGFKFEDKVDCVGQILWLWHRDQKPEEKAYQLLKDGKPLRTIPPNWKDHLKSSRHRALSRRSALLETFRKLDSFDDVSEFADLNAKTRFIPLNDRHRRLISHLLNGGTGSWWEDEHHCLVTHTLTLKEAHANTDLGIRGLFGTMSSGSTSHNCFLFPSRDGWIARRYGKGVKEHPYWREDTAGWTTCWFDREPDLDTVLRFYGAKLGTKADYEFPTLKVLRSAMVSLGYEFPKTHEAFMHRVCFLIKRQDMLIVQTPYVKDVDPTEGMDDWRKEPNNLPKRWVYVFRHKARSDAESDTNDLVLRAVCHKSELEGFFVRTINSSWMKIPASSAVDAVQAYSFTSAEAKAMRGSATINPWTMVNLPFETEYPGDRKWNMNSAQLAYSPSPGEHPTWDLLIEHMSENLKDAVSASSWCKKNQILVGADYLLIWIAYLFQKPSLGLPYLCFYSEEQNTGKSTFHEAIGSLFAERRGYVNATQALRSTADFNGELHGAVLAVIEEVDISEKKIYDKLKDWVTSPYISIHPKGMTPFTVENTTHWVQVSNNADYCPVFPGDTRIVLICVSPIQKEIDSAVLSARLHDEAPAFLNTILNLELPAPHGRLQIPVLETADKISTLEAKKSPPEEFLECGVYHIAGQLVNASELYNETRRWIKENHGPSEAEYWTDKKISKLIPRSWTKGITGRDRKTYYANVSLDPRANASERWVQVRGRRELTKASTID